MLNARVTAGARTLRQVAEPRSIHVPRLEFVLGAAGAALAFLIAVAVALYLFWALRRAKTRVKRLEASMQSELAQTTAMSAPTTSVAQQPTTSLSLKYMVKSAHDNVRFSHACCCTSPAASKLVFLAVSIDL